MGKDFLFKFQRVLDADRRTRDIPDWMLAWLHQERRRDESGRADMDFWSFRGGPDLVSWMEWSVNQGTRPMYFADEMLMPQVARALATDRRILDRLDVAFADDRLMLVARANAEDYLFQTLYPVPERQRVRAVLDFGAGYGRQFNLRSQDEGFETYVAMDAVPMSYCVQNLYLSAFDGGVADYVDSPADFAVGRGAFHLPTWRVDLLADEFFDAVLCVQVLTELDPNLTVFMLKQFRRVLKPGGMLYVRDHDGRFSPNGVPLNSILQALGFVIEFRPHVRDKQDTWGIPKIWRKIDDDALMCLP